MVRHFRQGHPWRARLQQIVEVLRPHKTLLAVAVGLSMQWGATQITVSRPLVHQVRQMEAELARTTDRMNHLVAARGTAQQSQDLLSSLEAQRKTLASAEKALTDIRQLRMNLEQESRRTAAASASLTRMGEFHQRVSQAGDQAERLTAVLEQLVQLHRRIESLSHPMNSSLALIERADGTLARLEGLQTRLIEQGDSLPAALETIEQQQQLQATLVDANSAAVVARDNTARLLEVINGLNSVEAGTVSAAADHASDLLALHDLLADARTLRLNEAEANLRALLTTQSALLRATPQIGEAAENLELLTEFQTELTQQLDSLVGLRKELMEVALLRETIAAVTRAVGPLAELSDIRRLDAVQVRAMAREILDRRTAQALSASEAATESVGTPVKTLLQEELEAVVPDPMDP